ncbi:hypothetical protein B0H16DRAFT_1411273 [Mycena metata]|uniref:Glucose-methanol-choline oxidoreductase C-terminal domain-containing protein n=1 Tax=Mycena metata TaxID=1033252 RepID=A0AAD7JS30_9AGAR|nr:hypothetical protein B0H16DRAFT_1411273 [Mycena metata]
MAPENDAVPRMVDDRLRVHGVRNLRIADCGILPGITAKHPMATVVMVEKKCVHMILGGRGCTQNEFGCVRQFNWSSISSNHRID